MKRTMLVAVLAIVAVFAIGAMPAGAAQGGGAAAVLSPRLTDGFPCQGGGTGVFHAFQRFLNNQAASYAPCDGTIYSAGQGAVNTATLAGSGVDDGNPYNIVGAAGSFSATYTYSEPCQDLDGAGPAPSEAVTGEAAGSLTVSGAASGNYGANLVTGGSTTVNFWWSRVGLTAVVGLRNLSGTVTHSGGSAGLSEPDAVGLAAAVFIPTQSPQCTPAPDPVPPPNAIIIASPSLNVAG